MLKRAVCLLFLCVWCAGSEATLIAYDGFAAEDYTAGALAGQNPVLAGFDGAWTPGDNIHVGDDSVALTWPGLATDDSGGAFSSATGNRAGRDLDPAMGGTNVYYLSVLMRNSAIDAGVNNYRALELWNFGNRNLQIGANRDIDGDGLRWGMRAIDNNGLRVTAADAVAGEAVLAVARITFSAESNGDAVRLWINPEDLASETLSTNYVELTGFDFVNNNINNFRFAAFSGSSTAYWDELRIGTTWGSVLPEPQIPTFTVTYVGSGAIGGLPPVDEMEYEEEDVVTVLGNTNALVRTNHSFDGWNTASDGTGDAYDPADTFVMGDADVTLYAQWQKIPPGAGFYEVLYHGNGHTGGEVPEDLEYYEEEDSVTVLGPCNMFRQGWAFEGWNTEIEGEGVAYQPDDVFQIGTANVDLYAQWSENPSTGNHVRVFVLAGQSNMRGSGRVNQAPEEWRPLAGVLFDDTVPGTPESFSSEWGAMGAVDDDMGPEIAFAAAMREAYPEDTIAIVKVSQSGTGLPFWRNPGQGGHDALMARIDTVRGWLDDALLANDIPSWEFSGFIWMQGENEANSIESVALAYEADFDDLATKVRAEIGNPDLPVVLGRISIQLDPNAPYNGPVNQPQLDYVRAGQVSWATNDAHGGWVDTDDLTLIDNWHFGSIGQVTLGQRFAEAWFHVAEERPILTLRRSAGQAAQSSAASVVYDAVFSDSVTGFAPVSVEVLGDTGADHVAVEEVAPHDGTTYRVTVTGMSHPGTVDIRVSGGAATAGDLQSLPGLAEGTRVLYAAHPGVADLLVYEPFTSVVRPLHRLQTGMGWNGAGWMIQNNVTNSYVTANAAPLTYTNLLSSPGYATGGESYNASARALDLEKTFAGYMTSRGAGAVDVPGTTLWMSYLIRAGDAGQRQRISLLRGTGATHSDANNMVKVKRIDGTWQLVVLNNAAQLDTEIPVVAGQTHLMVLRLHIGGPSDPSSVHLWVDPDPEWLGGDAPDLATATVSHSVTSADFKFGRIHWYPGQAAGNGMLDEIRLGTTFASVTPSLVEATSAFDAWRAAEFTPEELADEQISGPFVDPDESGIKNLMRFALGLGRHEPYNAVMPSGEVTDNALFRHVRLIDGDSGVIYVINVTDNLVAGEWLPVTVGEQLVLHGTEPTGNGQTEVVVYRVPAETLVTPKYFRLAVQLAE